VFLTGAVFAQTSQTGSLATNDGEGISGDRVRRLLDILIPTGNAHSTLIVLTQCYGGDMVDDLSQDRENTHVISGTSEGEVAYYGGYDDDAAEALDPAPGRTSADVHTAGTAGSASGETPSQGGSAVSLEPVDPVNGPIKSRHVLVYAGTPDGTSSTSDDQQRTEITENFADEPNTTVTTVGGDGTGGWEFPGTLRGLILAMLWISLQMNPEEQFVMFVTDHGDQDTVDQNVDQTGSRAVYQSDPLLLHLSVYTEMNNEPANEAAVTVFVETDLQPSPCDITVGVQYFAGVSFDTRLDLNDNGAQDPGDGWEARVLVDETLLDPSVGDPVTIDGLPGGLPVSARLTSGAIPKRKPGTVDCTLTCQPPSGTVPFTTNLTVTLTNNYLGLMRRLYGRLDLTLAGGQFYPNWRTGTTNIAAGSSYATSWNQSIPALGSVIGDNVINLFAADVTPPPYNLPPYPPAGDTATDFCTVNGIAP
jgi:hypothetical protein